MTTMITATRELLAGQEPSASFFLLEVVSLDDWYQRRVLHLEQAYRSRTLIYFE